MLHQLWSYSSSRPNECRFVMGIMQSMDQGKILQCIDYKWKNRPFKIVDVLEITHYGIYETETVADQELKI